MVKNLYDTKLPLVWTQRCNNEFNYAVAEAHYEKLCFIAFKAITSYLSRLKSKENPITFIVDSYGKEVVCATVEYFADEKDNDSAEGSWTLTWSFDTEDIPANTKKYYLSNDTQSHTFFDMIGAHMYGMTFSSPGDLINTVSSAFEEIKKYLDENAKENDIVGVELPEVFQARVTVENGVKIFSIEPAGEIKMLIKDDASIEK